jgi:hypothetical protein
MNFKSPDTQIEFNLSISLEKLLKRLVYFMNICFLKINIKDLIYLVLN